MEFEYLKSNWDSLQENTSELHTVFFEQLRALYSEEGRHYHTLDHVETMLRLVDRYGEILEDRASVLWAIWYHDAIYDPTRKDNELESAKLAENHLIQLGYVPSFVSKCYEKIIDTATHEIKGEFSMDTAFFLDVDLSILAADREAYQNYTKQIREEYQMFPMDLYRSGRKKALEHIAASPFIYETTLFRELWEVKARENIQWELEQL